MHRDAGFDAMPDTRHGESHGAVSTRPFTPILTFTTQSLPAPRQFAYWQECNNGLADVTRDAAHGHDGFAASGSTWRMGGMALSAGQSPACHYRRSPGHIRRDSIDHWVISVIRRGSRSFRTDGVAVSNTPGAAIITSFDRPYETSRDDSAWLQLYIPRDSLGELGHAMDAMRYQRLDSAMGRLLEDYILLLASRMPQLSAADAERLVEATRNMVVACIRPTADHLAQAAPQTELVQLAQIKRLIRQHLGSATLGPERLSRRAGVSRSKLYRMFEPYGGVARFIQTERLHRAHAALSDAGDTRSIGSIAEDVGLFDLSSFGRMFRATFGCSPSELRQAASRGGAVAPPPRQCGAGHGGGLQDMLRAL
jgi:AraC-like DNA-binding protein